VKQTLLLLGVLVTLSDAAANAQSNPSTQTHRPSIASREAVRTAAPGGAEWSREVETDFGITREQFVSFGLVRLTAAEWSRLNQALLTNQGKTLMNVASWTNTYTCPTLSRSGKIRVLVEDAPTNPNEVMSMLRQGLRAVSDVEIVYDRSEANLGISILAMTTETTAGVRTGYTAAVVIKETCKSSLLGKEYPVDDVHHFSIFTGSAPSDVVTPAVAMIDTHGLELIRKQKAALNKLSESSK